MSPRPASSVPRWRRQGTALVLAVWLASGLHPRGAHAEPADPLGSARWSEMELMMFDEGEVVFDERVRVIAPPFGENPLDIPIMVDATALADVREILVFSDFNPILKVLRFEPHRAAARLGFRLKLQQSSPVRAAARTGDGVWHVGGVWVNTSGGGCTMPSVGSGSPVWQDKLNQVSARRWRRDDGTQRLRLRVIHPMDSGLAPGIPAFHIETLAVHDGNGEVVAQLSLFEPVAENPIFSLDLPGTTPLRLVGRDNNGNRIDHTVTP